ncbi:hypothetical protein HDU87_002841 [Geranomyces variabilis]|uniref:NAD(P)H-hydrate epimerase n=1 Tax=Geranomyces variabilis TaxID=109894 RepID=A0AAD5TR09_9FUNG|nr:hypothetical protein HDU87_002841 [Geranomyces variabilis]
MSQEDGGGFSLDQLMELAGLSVAQAICSTYPVKTHKNILVVAGGGNNGGDGLVAARHLCHFGYAVTVYYPKPTDKPIYKGLQTQLRALQVPFVDEITNVLKISDVIVDAIFGFGFSGSLRAPFDTIIPQLIKSGVPIACVDVPSGWDVAKGRQINYQSRQVLLKLTDVAGMFCAKGDPGDGIKPDLLISLSVPKRGVESFKGKHFLGGRFVPPDLAKELGFSTPWSSHPGMQQCVDITSWLKL